MKTYEENFLWKILVPTIRNDGRPIKTRFHRVWDSKIREITGGLTINPPVRGEWIGPEDDLYHERMIPVEIACSAEEIREIALMTKEYYEQEAVFYYLISDRVCMV